MPGVQWNFCTTTDCSLSAMCVYGLVTINILLDEWDRTATRESQLLDACNAAALRDQDQVTLLAQPSDW